MDYQEAYKIAQSFSRKFLRSYPPILVGSLRRKEAVIGDIDLLIIGDASEPILNKLKANQDVTILSAGTKTIMIRYKKTRVDIFFTTKENLIPALLHHTGSKIFNIRMRKQAKDLGYKLNQYGLFNKKGIKINVSNEKEIFKILELPYKKPENRNH